MRLLCAFGALFSLFSQENANLLNENLPNEFQLFALRVAKAGSNDTVTDEDLALLAGMNFCRLGRYFELNTQIKWGEIFDLCAKISGKACFSDVLAWSAGSVSENEIDSLSYKEFYELSALRGFFADEVASKAHRTFEILDEVIPSMGKYGISNSKKDRFFKAVRVEVGSLVMDFEHCPDLIEGELVEFTRDIFRLYHLPNAWSMLQFFLKGKKIMYLNELRIHKLKSNDSYNEDLLRILWDQQDKLQGVSIRFVNGNTFFWRRGQANNVASLKNVVMSDIK